jgi:hypothetical protein
MDTKTTDYGSRIERKERIKEIGITIFPSPDFYAIYAFFAAPNSLLSVRNAC